MQETPSTSTENAMSLENKIDHQSWSGSVSMFNQLQYFDLKSNSLLNPNEAILNLPRWNNRAYFILNFKSDTIFEGKLKGQVRPIIDSNRYNTHVSVITDELFLEFPIQKSFLFFGKRNIRDGVGLSFSPTDFLGELKNLEKSKKEEERRIEREGDDIIGGDFLWENSTLSFIYSPKSDTSQNSARALIKLSKFIPTMNSDASIQYFNSKVSGLGANFSTSIKDNIVIYVESAYRWGHSTHSKISLVQDGRPRLYSVEPEENNVSFFDILLGGHYTFKNNANLIAEYYYHGGGYSQNEWEKIINFIHYSNNQYKLGLFPELMSSYLLQANRLMDFGKMKQNYLFLRYSTPHFLDKTQLSLIGLLNMDDESYLINPYAEYWYLDNLCYSISAYFFNGPTDSEFGNLNWNSQAILSVKYLF